MINKLHLPSSKIDELISYQFAIFLIRLQTIFAYLQIYILLQKGGYLNRLQTQN